jgi:hypothetical protein
MNNNDILKVTVTTPHKIKTSLLTSSVLCPSESYIMNDGQSTSLSWNKAPIWDLRLDFYYCQTIAGLMRGGVCCLQILLAHASAVILMSE